MEGHLLLNRDTRLILEQEDELDHDDFWRQKPSLEKFLIENMYNENNINNNRAFKVLTNLGSRC